MPLPRPDTVTLPADNGHFQTTHWSLVLRAGNGHPAARAALAALCSAYWYPVYAYLRKRTNSITDAEDLTQGFFAHLLEPGRLAAADPARGKFRTFLLSCCCHYLANEWDRNHALKRGGGRPPEALDFAAADVYFRREPADVLTPERLFDRRWALTLIEQALAGLEREYADKGKAKQFELLKPALNGSPDANGYAAAAVELGMTVAAVKKAAQRLRERYRDLLRDQIAQTVRDPAEIDEEIRDLFAAVAR
jgi:RNA polymerase sigma-70 factor (ECF subfamily)